MHRVVPFRAAFYNTCYFFQLIFLYNFILTICLFPAAGFAVALLFLLLFYKLKTKDVQIMAQYNNGQISKEEAEAILAAKYGPAGER